MGMDPKAILYYGFRLPGDIDEHLSDDELDIHDSADQWKEQRSPVKPAVEGYKGPEWDQWRAKRKEWEARPENVEIGLSGSDGDMVYYLHCACKEKSVEWSEHLCLTGHDFGPQPECDAMLKAFCEQYKVPFQQPEWHLACLYF